MTERAEVRGRSVREPAPLGQALLRRGAVERLQLWLLLAVLAVLPWLISPGRTQPDTKIDLTLTPWRYVGRSLDAWNNHAGLGELQNQAYGYLFPMGPVFGVCRSLAVPAWATQRIWWTVLLVVSFLGAQQLLRRLGVAGSVPALVGGAAYALAPRMLTVLPVISVEAWPMALAPWLVIAVLPLARRELRRGELIRALALAGVLTAALGGVNATASGVVLALPFAFLATHAVGRRRLVPWFVAVLLGALWWLLPLVVLGRYAYPFLDYIETASITTAVTSVPNVLRGADDWIAYILDSAGHPVWQGGWVLAQSVTAILATGLVAAVGCWGLLRQRGHLARWTLLCVVGATLFMVLGHGGTVGSPLSEQVRALLDGSLAPLRNIHKADPVLRLPLVVGFTAVLQRVSVSRRARDRFVPAFLALAVVVAATPIWQGRVGASDAYGAIPAQWTQVAHEIDRAARDSGGSTMLLPNSRTSTYTWGSTTDEPLSALATSAVVTRAAAPLGIPASTRILDVVDQLAASGEPQPSLAAGLTRLGIKRVVLRRNLAASVQARPWQRVQRTLARSPGFRVAATYGSGRSALTVYDVTAAPGATTPSGATAYGAIPVTVAGGPEAMFALHATGTLSAQQWLELDGAISGHADVVTDSMPWRSYNNGVPTAFAYSPTLTRDDRTPTHIGAKDLLPAGNPAQQPAREWIGWSHLDVSSSAADPFAKDYLGVRDGPAAAFDHDPTTAWLTGDHEGTAWLRGTFPGRTVRGIRLQLAGRQQHATLPDRVEVRVGDRQVSVAVRDRSEITVPVPATQAGAIEVRLHAPSDAVDPVLGIIGMTIPGITLGSVIDVPQRVAFASQSLLVHRLPEDAATITRQVHLADSDPVSGTVWLRSSGGSVAARCGAAGTVTVRSRGGMTTRIPLRLKGPGQPARGALVEAATCGSSNSGRRSGGDRTETISITGTSRLTTELATFGKHEGRPRATRTVTSVTGDSGHRVIQVSSGAPAVVALTEGFNAGWQATDQHGHALHAVEVDGWRQGFRLNSAGADTITMAFEPTTPQRLGLLVGGLVALALLLAFLAAAFVCRRRTPARRGGREISPDRDQVRGTLGLGTPRPARCSATQPAGRIRGALAAVLVGFLAAGPAGLLAGLAAAATPVRWLRQLAAGALMTAAAALGFFGVVDARSAGAIAGQLLGTVTLCALARAGCVFGGAPTAALAAPPATPTPPPRAR